MKPFFFVVCLIVAGFGLLFSSVAQAEGFAPSPVYTAPGLNFKLTNLSDPAKSVTLNVTGAAHQSVQNGNTVIVFTGRNLVGDPLVGFALLVGTFSYIVDSNFNVIQPLTAHGQIIDVCKLIA